MVLQIIIKTQVKRMWAQSNTKPLCNDPKFGSTGFFFELLEKPKNERQHSIIGGKTILGKIFSYQEKTGMSVNDILQLPYIFFVISMADAPQIDYEKKKEKKEQKGGFGTKLSDLSPDILAQMR